MAGAKRLAGRILLVVAAAGTAALAVAATAGSPAPVALLPPGAAAVVEMRNAKDVAERLQGTRFAAAFAGSATRSWILRTEAARAFDEALAGIKNATGVSLGRGIAFDLIGKEAAIGWYAPADGAGSSERWVAGGRLSLRAWAAAAALRTMRRLGLGSSFVAREEAAGRAVYAIGAGTGRPLRIFFAGRVLVASPDRALLLKAARAGHGAASSVSGEPAWRSLRGALPGRGDLYVWLRGRGRLLDEPAADRAGDGGIAILLRAGKTVEIDVAAEPAPASPESAPGPLPGLPLLRQSPLLFLASSGPVPEPLADLLRSRAGAAATRRASPPADVSVRPGKGYALAVTGSAAGSGLFPAPQGLLLVGMESAAEAARTLPLLFPPGARTAEAGGARAFATRESFPLAGEFELWGAAIGPRLVFATDASLIAAAAADPGSPADLPIPNPEWQIRAVAAVSMEKAQPLLRRWAAPLSGLIAARWPEAPDLARDIELLAALGAVRAVAGSDGRRDRAAVTLTLRDLP